jgi:hypothetical protein
MQVYIATMQSWITYDEILFFKGDMGNEKRVGSLSFIVSKERASLVVQRRGILIILCKLYIHTYSKCTDCTTVSYSTLLYNNKYI